VNRAAEILFNYLRDVIYNPARAKLDLEQLPEDFRDLGQGLEYLVECVFETKQIAHALSRGDLDGKQPSRGNELAAPLKSLQASLKHLTWQTEQVAKGDYRQRVDFMGSFAAAFNTMVQLLDERRQALMDEKSKLTQYVNLLLSNCIDIILIFGTDGKLALASNSFLQSCQFSAQDDVQGKTFQELFAPLAIPEDLRQMHELLRIALSDKASSESSLELDFKHSGTMRFYRVSVTPMLDENKIIVGAMTILHDETATVLAQRETERARALAERSSYAKTHFLARMSHEMRTPMNAIIGMTNIARTSDGERTTYCLDKISEASQHLLGVIDDVLDMSNLETDSLELSCAEVGLENMLRRVTDSFLFSINERKQKFIADYDKNLPANIITDEKRLSQVISNLLSNAVKFTPESGSITFTASVSARENDLCTLLFAVKDTGIGMSEDEKRHIFVPFEQADGGLSRKYEGTGLGLAISKRLVEMLDGRIWAESELDAGSSFFFEIKARSVSGASIPTNVTGGEREEQNLDGMDFSGKSVLVAEDIEINREIMSALLEETGIEISFANDGAQAVEKFSSAAKPYDIILMDIHMPEMDGYEATRRIRASAHPQAKSVPIVAMTANVFQQDIDNCLACGMNDHLGKPVEFATVIEKLRKYLAGT
jgi:PAS domain S-box-containing protein